MRRALGTSFPRSAWECRPDAPRRSDRGVAAHRVGDRAGTRSVRRYVPTRSVGTRRAISPRRILTALVLCSLTACEGTSEPSTQRVPIADRVFELELALDDEARHRGLSDRPAIADDGGMLFVFPDARERTFVMRDCLTPIDIIFLDPGGRVVQTHQMRVEPYGTPDSSLTPYHSAYPAQFAIELKGGTLDTLGLEKGTKIPLPVRSLKQRVH